MLILASQSPRRKELLAHLNMPFTVRVADIDEAMDPAKPPAEEVARVSLAKALAIPREEADTVIAADTIVVLDDKVLGKPCQQVFRLPYVCILKSVFIFSCQKVNSRLFVKIRIHF